MLRSWSDAVERPIPMAEPGVPTVLNAGSPGQPREPTACPPLVLWLDLDRKGRRFGFQRLAYDERAHAQRLLDADLSCNLLQRLRAYHPFLPATVGAQRIN